MERLTELQFAGMAATDLRALMAVSIAIGTLYCFLGYRVLRFALGVTGFLLAGCAAALLTAWMTQGNAILTTVALCIGGICGACALFFLYKVGVFCLGMAGGALVAKAILGGSVENWMSSVVLGSAVFGGLSGLLIERPIVTLATACLGAWGVVHGLAFFVLGVDSVDKLQTALERPDAHWTVMACWIALTIAGALTQLITHKHREPSSEN